jgi:uncharacterized protein YijF (DUF1287 family)
MFKMLSVLLFAMLSTASIATPAFPQASGDPRALVNAARRQIGVTLTYDPADILFAYSITRHYRWHPNKSSRESEQGGSP